MSLVIVESAAKAKIIQKYLNEIADEKIKAHRPYTVIASFGHVRDLPFKSLGVDTESWTPEYQILPGKEKIVKNIQKHAAAASRVYLASDDDAEGEAIAFHLREILACRRECRRITFREITRDALREAVMAPRDIDMNRVSAQESRRILDRLVGYELSPLLWRRFASGGLSAGRVQSAALKMCVDRAAESAAHTPEPFWVIEGEFSAGPARASEKYTDEAEVAKIMKKLARASDWTATVSENSASKGPSAPFTTSTLQQEAYSRHGLSAKRTMQLAQGLYESGLITYMRTDSVALAAEAKIAIHKYIAGAFGEELIATKAVYKIRATNAQQAHEAIRPTNPVNKSPEGLDPYARKVYDLIWRRAIASQMVAAKYAEFTYVIGAGAGGAVPEFIGKHRILIEPGYLQVYQPDEKPAEGELAKWRARIGDNIPVKAIKFSARGDATRAAGLYNEPGLIKALELKGIGRPSTFAAIIDKLYAKGYIVKGTNPQQTIEVTHYTVTPGAGAAETEKEVLVLGGQETDRMVPSSLGERVAEYLADVTPYLLDTGFTASMEDQLDKIIDAETTKDAVLGKFYDTFSESIKTATATVAAAAKKKKKSANAPPAEPSGPRNILRDFATAAVVQTRFGPALFLKDTKTFMPVMPFVKWRNIAIEDISEDDVGFLRRFPIKFDGTDREIEMGRYGLYVKDIVKNENMKLPMEKWDKVYNQTITKREITALVPSNGAKTSAGRRRTPAVKE